MSPPAKRGIAAAGTVVIAGMANIATGELTQRWSLAWWITVALLVLVGGGLQAWLTLADRPSGGQRVSHTKVGGSLHQKATGPGEQSVTDSDIRQDLTQEQG